VAALRCGKAVQMHYQFLDMHCQLHCLYFTRKSCSCSFRFKVRRLQHSLQV